MLNLLTLDLSFNKITNVNFSGIHLYDDVNVRPRIETILLNANELTSINMHLPNLCELNAGNKVSNTGENNLNTFNCNLPNLRKLNLSHNNLSSISGNLNSLEILYMDGNNVQSTRAFMNLHLRILSLESQKCPLLVSDITIDDLRLQGNRIIFDQFSSTSLDLSNCKLEHIQTSHITHLNISSNFIKDISPLMGVKTLESLDVQTNLLSDISSLIRTLGSLKLKTLVIKYHPLIQKQPCQFIRERDKRLRQIHLFQVCRYPLLRLSSVPRPRVYNRRATQCGTQTQEAGRVY
jgi:Leucine-rich repeat (LRR) protein